MNPLAHSSVRTLAALSIIAMGAAIADDYTLDWRTMDGGGATRSTGGAFALSGTIGQADAGVLAGGPFTLSGGFWFGQVRCDCNYDAGVNLLDYVDYQNCLSGPGGGLIDPACACFDLDEDDDVDLHDFSALQAAVTG